MRKLLFILLGTIMVLGVGCDKQRDEIRLLVFSKTLGWRHQSIPAGKTALLTMAAEKGWVVDTTEDASAFTEENLGRYSAVIFLNTTGDVLNTAQQRDFERYIQSGGGFVGIHSAADTEYDWPWYGRLVGAYFTSHPNNPNVLDGKMDIVNTDHPSTAFFGQKIWNRQDEFYNFKKIYHGEPDGIVPLIQIDETSYSGGTNGDFHPMSWYHEYDGGRAFYTNFGHTDETYSEDLYLQHVAGGIEYAIGDNRVNDYSKVKTERFPDEGRFVVTVLAERLDEPEELEVLPDGKVLFTQRKGEIMLYDPADGQVREIANLAVFHQRPGKSNLEEGLVGLALDPDFEQNHWLYLYYAPAGEDDKFNLSRFQFENDSLDLASETIIMEVPIQRLECCHTGGCIQFGPDGLLYLSTGDNSNPFETSYAPINELPGRGPWDAQKSSANMNDLRGKILRIRVNDDATYSIPDGNLFAADGSEGRPEIYVMGCRNPYRISIDSKTSFLYWGDVGPDAQIDSTRGPRGYDEVNQARNPGFFGWPYFVGNNYPYAEFDFATGELGEKFDPVHPVNNSPNNTGGQNLPSVQPPFIYYPYARSPEFPMLGSGGRNAMAGPVFHKANFKPGTATFPDYYEDKLFIYDFMRDWIFVVNMDEEGNLDLIEPFMADRLKLSSPMDMEFGHDGAMYILEYGTRWFARNEDARLIKIEYQAGNRTPKAAITVDERYGAAPFEVAFSAGESIDPDGETMSYSWDFGDGSTGSGEEVSHSFDKPGVYTTILTVSDPGGESQQTETTIHVGNAPPEIGLVVKGNQTFFWRNVPFEYGVMVSDAEDGTTPMEIPADRVAVTFEYLDQTEDRVMAALGHEAAAAQSLSALGKDLISESGCIACHALHEKIVGPAYADVARKYQDRPDAREYLVGKILNGGSGVWGGAAMAAQEQLDENQAIAMASYILTLAQEPESRTMPLVGDLGFDQHNGNGSGSSYLFSVSYQDQGAAGSEPIRRDHTFVFRSPRMEAENLDLKASSPMEQGANVVRAKDGDVVALGTVDFTGLSQVVIGYRMSRGAVVTLHAGSPDSEPLGTVEVDAAGREEGQVRMSFTKRSGLDQLYLVVSHPEGNSGINPILHLDYLEFLAPAAL